MLYRKMDKTGDDLSILGLGYMRLPRKGARVDEEQAIRQIRYAIDRGVNYVEASPMLPGSGVWGKALAGGYREKVKLAVISPMASLAKKREDMDKLLDVELRKMKTGYIDYFLFHGISGADWKKMKDLGVVDFIEKARADGRIRHIGFQSHTGTPEFKRIVDDYGWDFCQIVYNVRDENNQNGKEGLKYAAAKGLGIITLMPLQDGSLANAPPKEVQAIWDEADVKRTPAEWAMRWVWDQPEVTVMLSERMEEKPLEEYLRIADEALPNSLSEKELDMIGRVKDAYHKRLKVGCTGCNDCLPCPAGVNIPGCFEYYNKVYEGNAMMAKTLYYTNVGDKSFASRCDGCNKCVKACARHIDIPVQLKAAAGVLESPGARAMFFVMGPALNTFLRLERWRNLRKARV